MVKKIFIILSIFIIGCTPKIKQHILVVMRSSPAKISPEESVYLHSSIIMRNIYESLVKIGPNFEIQPSLAISWETIDALHWRFYLRKNVSFHSGKVFTGFDVLQNFERAKKIPIYTNLISEIKSIKIETPYKILITLNVPSPTLLNDLSGFYITGENDQDATGPYTVKLFTTDSLILKKNLYYWNKNGYPDIVKILFIPDEEKKVKTFLKRKADILFRLPVEYISFIDTSEYQIKEFYPPSGIYLCFNLYKKRMQNIKLRKAISSLIDKKIFSTQGIPIFGFFPSVLIGFSNHITFQKVKFNEAKNYIREKGIRTLSILVSSALLDEVSPVKTMLENAGLKVKFDIAYTSKDFFKKLHLHQTDMFFIHYIFSSGDIGDAISDFFHTKNRLGEENLTGYSNLELDSLIEISSKIIDTDTRNTYLEKAQQILENDIPVIPLYIPKEMYIFKKGIEMEVKNNFALPLSTIKITK